MAKNFKNLLAGIHQKSMNEQHQIINTTLLECAKEKEQVDDILVMGIKF